MIKFGAILSAIGCGLTFSINSVDIHQHLTNTKVTPTELSIDGNFGNGLLFVPFFIYKVVSDPSTYSLSDYFYINLHVFSVVGAGCAISAALKFGKAGPV